jgi:hypothetical protein
MSMTPLSRVLVVFSECIWFHLKLNCVESRIDRLDRAFG